MNLKEIVRQCVLRELPYDRADADLVAYLNGLDAHGLLVVYHNWMSRRVNPQPRTVHKARAFQQNRLTTQRVSDLTQIIADIEQGRDLTKYLSRDIVRAVVQVPGQSRRRDLDLMLNDWGVHHLHISTQIDPDGFVSRGKQKNADEPLLFAVFQQQTAYLIDIMKHGDWTRNHVLEVLVTEWPDEGIIHQIPSVGSQSGTTGSARRVTEVERATLRGKHGDASFQFGDKEFLPAGGIMAIGTTMQATIWSDKLLHALEIFEEEFKSHPAMTM